MRGSWHDLGVAARAHAGAGLWPGVARDGLLDVGLHESKFDHEDGRQRPRRHLPPLCAAGQPPGCTQRPHHGAVLFAASWILLGAAREQHPFSASCIALRSAGGSRRALRPLAPGVHLHGTFRGAARQEDGAAF